ncbi:hypothetical protein COT78_03260 [Candidatus Berkelbacteria bacterium CG10_big_fil_rev_8_21_14_0_10_43_13]|uniref:Peptidase S26 domain-containing protein n=1 Tax=Candidatus Berkelbacteria bacterium CG10_big_fil_rev_8_21_14_0_10_43_13 TaxID=1974514 RepID=A0A2H0W813_9BACT|nr:MAG: hypothetical protein COT78_03260 [Candidatus Berkelbacteria bacterium CG10_big_fil_rev_8_21_14_0_10_43_13]
MAAHQHGLHAPVASPTVSVSATAGTNRLHDTLNMTVSRRVVRTVAILGLLVLVLPALGFSVNYGPSMSHLGLFYWTSWGKQPTTVGQIVRFAPPDEPVWRKYIGSCVKRVTEIRPDGYWLEGDNAEQSKDCRDWGKAVPANHVAGVVTWCWSWERARRTRTPEGRLRNWVDFHTGPVSVRWNPRDVHVWAELKGDQMVIHSWYKTVFGPKKFDDIPVGNDFWNPDGSVTYTCLTGAGYPSLRRWSLVGGEKVVKECVPNVVERKLGDGTTLRAFSSEQGLDPCHAFDVVGWGPVMASSTAGHFNRLDVDYLLPRKVCQISATWTGGESLAVFCSDDGSLWQEVCLFPPPPPCGEAVTIVLKRPISSKHWRFELVNDRSSIEGGMTLAKLQLR